MTARRTPLRPLLGLAAVVVALGVVVGGVWAQLAPVQRFAVVDAQTLALLPTESAHVFVGTVLFLLAGLVVGLLSAAVAWRWHALRGPLTLLVLAGASLLAALVAREVGLALVAGPPPVDPAPGTVITRAPELRTWVVLVGQPLGAALGYAIATLLADRDDLGVADGRWDVLSSASPARPADPPAPAPPAAR